MKIVFALRHHLLWTFPLCMALGAVLMVKHRPYNTRCTPYIAAPGEEHPLDPGGSRWRHPSHDCLRCHTTAVGNSWIPEGETLGLPRPKPSTPDSVSDLPH